MNKKYLIIYLFIFLIYSNLLFPQAHLKYQKRQNNRFEGIKEIKVGAPDLELLSFTGYREKVPLDSDVILKIKFYVETKDNLYITAKELYPPLKFYLMKPTKKNWLNGWQLFSPWPTAAVINPLDINVDHIGVVGRVKDDRIGSGHIVPLILYHSKSVSKIQGYELYLKPKETLRRVDYFLYPEGSRQSIVSESMRSPFHSMEPYCIPLDMTNAVAGKYKLLVKCKIKNKTVGPTRTYTFYHNPILD